MKKTDERYIALIDGEHYPPVVKDALGRLERSEGAKICAGVFLGGTEKLDKKNDLESSLGIKVFLDKDPIEGLARAVEEFRPKAVFDLSDEPVLSAKDRFRIASFLMLHGVRYQGSDFVFHPPQRAVISEKPSIMVGGTGKRVGKTAVGAYVARVLSGQEELESSYDPCIVTMGRGGPAEPEVIEGGTLKMDPEYFLKQVASGKHAASDHYEDALMSRVRTIGCRRCGGGFSGEPFYSIVHKGAELANGFSNDMVIFEGSGATNPPVHTDACIMVIGANQGTEYVTDFMGPFRVAMSDLIILTMCEEPMAGDVEVKKMLDAIGSIAPEVPVIKTVFRPKPLKEIRSRRAVLCTTAPEGVKQTLVDHLEQACGAKVVGVTHSLSDRERLKKELQQILEKNSPEILLTEVKAASMDVATKVGMDRSLEVVYVDNLPVVPGEGAGRIATAVANVARKAEKRFKT